MTLIIGLIFSNGFLANKVIGILEPAPHYLQSRYDVAIVLSGVEHHGMGIDGQYHLTESADRITEAARLYHDNLVDKILVSGGAADISNPQENEALSMLHLLADLKVNPDDILFENKSKNTHENAKFCKSILEEHETSLLITSAYHMPRAYKCFRKNEIVTQPYPVDFQSSETTKFGDFLPSISALQKWQIFTKEVVGLLAYKAMGYI